MIKFNASKRCCKEHSSIHEVEIYKDKIIYTCQDCEKITEKLDNRPDNGAPLWCKHPNNYIL